MVSKNAQVLHRKRLVTDMHSDVMVDVLNRREEAERNVLARIHLPRWEKGGVNASFLAVGGDSDVHPQTLASTLRCLEEFFHEVEESKAKAVQVTNAKELEQGWKKNQFGCFLILEGAMPVEESADNIQILYRYGVRSIGLTHNKRNQIADGAGEDCTGGGLTCFGRQVVRRMNEQGMIVDVAHMAEAGFWSVIECTDAPIIVSHANSRHICNHKRSLTDKQLEALAKNGGVVGISFYPSFVWKKNPTINHVLDHIDHIKRIIGVEHIGIGSDFIDFASEQIIGKVLSKSSMYGEYDYPKGLENIEKIPNLTKGLEERGYNADEINKIMGQNILNLIRKVVGS